MNKINDRAPGHWFPPGTTTTTTVARRFGLRRLFRAPFRTHISRSYRVTRERHSTDDVTRRDRCTPAVRFKLIIGKFHNKPPLSFSDPRLTFKKVDENENTSSSLITSFRLKTRLYHIVPYSYIHIILKIYVKSEDEDKFSFYYGIHIFDTAITKIFL